MKVDIEVRVNSDGTEYIWINPEHPISYSYITANANDTGQTKSKQKHRVKHR